MSGSVLDTWTIVNETEKALGLEKLHIYNQLVISAMKQNKAE